LRVFIIVFLLELNKHFCIVLIKILDIL